MIPLNTKIASLAFGVVAMTPNLSFSANYERKWAASRPDSGKSNEADIEHEEMEVGLMQSAGPPGPAVAWRLI